MNSSSPDYWRNYFKAANSDIFDVINQAIRVAASDCPREFRLRRDQIAERLFSCKMTRCRGCDKVELALPADHDKDCKSGCVHREECEEEAGMSNDNKVNSIRNDQEEFEVEAGMSNDNKVNSIRNNQEELEVEAGMSNDNKVNIRRNDQGDMNKNQMVRISYGEAEALTDEIEEENQMVGEVLRIKEVLSNSQEMSESTLFESLRRLQLMALSVDVLQATQIGKLVTSFRKHGSMDIRKLARTLIGEWKEKVDEWINAAKAIAECTPDSLDPSAVEEEEEGLPSIPLDEGALFATEPMELSQFFDGMDDDGNPCNSGEFNKNRENGRKLSLEKQTFMKPKHQAPVLSNKLAKDKIQLTKKPEASVRPVKASQPGSGSFGPPKAKVEQRVNNPIKPLKKPDHVPVQRRTVTGQQDMQKQDNFPVQRRLVTGQQDEQKPDNLSVQIRPVTGRQDKPKSLDEDTEEKYEASKRKLQERYQQVENAKRQRTIQVMELHDLPKQGLGHRNPHMKKKQGIHNRLLAKGPR